MLGYIYHLLSGIAIVGYVYHSLSGITKIIVWKQEHYNT